MANLTFDQLDRMGRLADTDTGRDRARARLIAGLTEGELLGRLGSRWVRWAATFGLPQPNPHLAPRQILRHPYRLASHPTINPDYLSGVLAVFDAGLAIAAAPIDIADTADYELLTTPWRRACLPSGFTPDSVYGPHTQPALALLRRARTLPPTSVQAICHSRTTTDHDQWAAARDKVEDTAIAWGYPWRPQCLFWDAAGESPTDPYLADALWAGERRPPKPSPGGSALRPSPCWPRHGAVRACLSRPEHHRPGFH